jgi:hypothetical protein
MSKIIQITTPDSYDTTNANITGTCTLTNTPSGTITVTFPSDTPCSPPDVTPSPSTHSESEPLASTKTSTNDQTAEKLCLFGITKTNLVVDDAIKYLMAQISATTEYSYEYAMEFVYSMNLTQLETYVYKIDWLTFPWKKLPQPIFYRIFSAIALERMAFFCGYFRAHYDSVSDSRREQMMNALWDKFQG